jgi:hypothetical protein
MILVMVWFGIDFCCGFGCMYLLTVETVGTSGLLRGVALRI